MMISIVLSFKVVYSAKIFSLTFPCLEALREKISSLFIDLGLSYIPLLVTNPGSR